MTTADDNNERQIQSKQANVWKAEYENGIVWAGKSIYKICDGMHSHKHTRTSTKILNVISAATNN